MRIISKFQDYYDSAAGYGIDKSLVYVRKTETMGNINVMPRYNSCSASALHFNTYWSSKYQRYYTLVRKCIVFCGTPYFIYHIERGENRYCYVGGDRIKTFTDLYEAQEFLETLQIKKIQRPYWDQWKDTKEAIKRVDWLEQHQQYNCPIFALYGPKSDFTQEGFRKEHLFLVGNPCLKDDNFYKFVDPYTAFQEISMFIGGVLSTAGNDMVQLTDADLHAKHGYDKWSFRKMPEKKT